MLLHKDSNLYRMIFFFNKGEQKTLESCALRNNKSPKFYICGRSGGSF